MELIVSLEHRFWRTPDGRYWSQTIYAHPFWARYLSTFDRVKILARVHDVPKKRDSWLRVDGDRVSFAPLPGYVGPWAFVQDFRKVRAAIRTALQVESAVLLHAPGMVATMAFRCLQPGRPYGVEVKADPHEYFSRHSVPHPLRPFWQWWFTLNLKKQCRQAACCLYVTERALQQRYPPGTWDGKQSFQSSAPGYSVGVSDVDLPDAAFNDPDVGPPSPATSVDNNGIHAHQSGRFRIIYVGSLERLVKAPDIIVTAFARALSAGLDAELAMIGDGLERPRIERLAQSLGMGVRVQFLGQLREIDAVRRELDASDLFILASWHEGLPRAMIEAMARGLPCIGSRVGGIPELLPDSALVRPGDVAGLTAKILQFARDTKLRAQMGQQNLASARGYHERILQPKRVVFFERLRDATHSWQKAGT